MEFQALNYAVMDEFISLRIRQYALWSAVFLKPGIKSEKNLSTAARCCGSVDANAASRNNEGRTVVT